jgi:hypothetical protein
MLVGMLVFSPEPWTAFVSHLALSYSQKAMNTSQAICRMREVIRRQHKALSCADGLAARQATPLPLEVASSFAQEVSGILAMGYLR